MATGKLGSAHEDEFTLLRLVRGELDEVTSKRLRRHLADCHECARLRNEMEELHVDLLACSGRLASQYATELTLSPRDPFRARPEAPATPLTPQHKAPSLALCTEASRQAEPLTRSLLEAATLGDRSVLAGLDLSALRERYALGHALDAAILRMVEGPERWHAFGKASAALIRPARRKRPAIEPAVEAAYPLFDLEGLASLAAGIACNWTGAFVRGERLLAHSYRCFRRGSCSDLRFAQVELAESQRRSFSGRPAEGLLLVERAEATFQAFGLEDQAARATGARALALDYLDRHDEAATAFRSALSVFERLELWNAYVSTLNGLGFTLLRMGQLDAARREFARALRRLSPTSHASVRAFVRANLARILLEAGRYADAAKAFTDAARLFSAQGAELDGLTVTLAAAECYARAGAMKSAGASFDRFRAAVVRLNALDSTLLESLEAALSGESPNLDLLETLRRQAEVALRENLRSRASG